MSTITGSYANAITPVAPRPQNDSAQNQQSSQLTFDQSTVTPIEAKSRNEASSSSTNQRPQHELSRQNQQNIEKERNADSALNQKKDIELQTKNNEQDRTNTKQIIEQKMEAQLVAQLKARDQEVRSHEMAHKIVGGKYAAGVSLEYTKGPDGVNYAKAGEVSISVSTNSNPELTVRKMQQIKQAALAPREPSNQDRAVAATATQLEMKAYAEIAKMERVEETAKAEAKDEYRKENTQSKDDSKVSDDNKRADNNSEYSDIAVEDFNVPRTERSPIEPPIEYAQSSGLNLNVIA
ncbi:MAG: hypothetical protein HRU38_07800 [Saccharospirillaceae bacterium]|nr:hypothetical protein [Pseudomonadales bacterium]NRB78557.1 hypothetical protein [Saccharospirillaceae bacterium]